MVQLARLHRAGESVAVHIADAEDEVICDVFRDEGAAPKLKAAYLLRLSANVARWRHPGELGLSEIINLMASLIITSSLL